MSEETNSKLLERIAEEVDLCRHEGAEDIAKLLEDAHGHIAELHSALARISTYYIGEQRAADSLRDVQQIARKTLQGISRPGARAGVVTNNRETK